MSSASRWVFLLVGLIHDKEGINLSFVSRTREEKREMRQLVAEEMFKKVLRAIFSVMYDVTLSEIFSNICLGWTTGGGLLYWNKAGHRIGSWDREWK